ncbi:MAG: succinyldiaminopimelate transaminase [Congregibacter sp.]
MNPLLSALRPYPFDRLNALFEGVTPPAAQPLIKLSVGEPRHAPPAVAVDALRNNLDLLAVYPPTKGEARLREAQAYWMRGRHRVDVDPDTQVLPVNGTREALFAIAQNCVDAANAPLFGCPNPFYQIYEGATLLAGGQTVLMDTRAENHFLPQPDMLDTKTWQAMSVLYLCSPGNPSGAVMTSDLLQAFITRAIEHDVVIVSDECYSEIYPDEKSPPSGLLAACRDMGNVSFQNCISMHSLSKRSNLPGLRSGFAAGDARLMREFLRYRGYHGSAMPPHHQRASEAAWLDETHVRENRVLYREKFAAVREILAPWLDLNQPEGSFYLWPDTGMDDETFAQRLYAEQAVVVLPGSYLGRETPVGNPGAGRVRIALVPDLADCTEAASRIVNFVKSL